MEPRKLSVTQRWTARLSRIIPAITLTGAAAAILLSLLRIIDLTIPENVIIALLALLAADALTERLSILERIEKELGNLSANEALRTRADLPSMESMAGAASEICLLAISGMSLSHRFLHFFREKAGEGCNIRIILLNPQSPCVEFYDTQYGIATAEREIDASLKVLSQLLESDFLRSRCEVRLSSIYLPFTIFAVDLARHSGSMIAEFHTYKTTAGERPHAFLTPINSPHWFPFFKGQFERAWSDSEKWEPSND